ncbi:MAG: glucose-6-phosphate isomerase, partial [Gammaproteobacteria bacterium]
VMLALTGLWNCHCLGAESYAVVPYDDRLRYLPDYLQQLEMESNGKRVGLDDAVLDHHTAPITWGGLGTNAQHAFFQLLHQGTRLVPVDFICALSHPAAPREHHDMLVANCFAQAEALMRGRSFADHVPDAQGVDLALHRQSPGNRPSSMLTMRQLDAHTLGALIALYEHKTFVQSVLWNINAFDQWGVELGKELATGILDEIGGAAPSAHHDPSTAALIARYRELR